MASKANAAGVKTAVTTQQRMFDRRKYRRCRMILALLPVSMIRVIRGGAHIPFKMAAFLSERQLSA